MSKSPEQLVVQEAYDIVRAEQNYIEVNKIAGGTALAGAGLVVVGASEVLIESAEHIGVLTAGMGMLTIMFSGAVAAFNICRRYNIVP